MPGDLAYQAYIRLKELPTCLRNPGGFKGWKKRCLYLQRLVGTCLEAISTRLHVGVCHPACTESSDTRAAWLSHDTTTRILVQASIDRAHDARRKAWHRRHGATPKSAAKQGPEASWRAARRRGDGGITLSDVSVGCTCGKAWGLRMQSLHVGHRFFHAKGVCELRLRRGSRKVCGRGPR